MSFGGAVEGSPIFRAFLILLVQSSSCSSHTPWQSPCCSLILAASSSFWDPLFSLCHAALPAPGLLLLAQSPPGSHWFQVSYGWMLCLGCPYLHLSLVFNCFPSSSSLFLTRVGFPTCCFFCSLLSAFLLADGAVPLGLHFPCISRMCLMSLLLSRATLLFLSLFLPTPPFYHSYFFFEV